LFYRIKQFWHALCPLIHPEELDWVQRILPVCALPLFFNQSLPERRHAIDVAMDLSLSYPEKHNLLIAALLHDCGKSQYKLKIWERIYIVLLQKASRKIWNLLLCSRPMLSCPLRTAQEHARWGAKMVQDIGLENEIVQLILYHHDPKTRDGQLLYDADNRH
jgi:putative nucleotidyltransferase with HDIG domain